MSPDDKAERVAHLRSAIAGIEAHPGRSTPARRSSFRSRPRFDPALGGGLSSDALHEIAPGSGWRRAGGDRLRPGAGGAFRGGASPRHRRRCSISEDFCARETGALYGPGLAAHGLGLDRLSSSARPTRRPCSGPWRRRSKAARWPPWSAKCGAIRNITALPPRAGCCLRRGPAARRPCSCMAARSGGPAPSPAPPKRALRSRRLQAGLLAPAGGRFALPGVARLRGAAVEGAAAALRARAADARLRRGADHPPRMAWRSKVFW